MASNSNDHLRRPQVTGTKLPVFSSARPVLVIFMLAVYAISADITIGSTINNSNKQIHSNTSKITQKNLISNRETQNTGNRPIDFGQNLYANVDRLFAEQNGANLELDGRTIHGPTRSSKAKVSGPENSATRTDVEDRSSQVKRKRSLDRDRLTRSVEVDGSTTKNPMTTTDTTTTAAETETNKTTNFDKTTTSSTISMDELQAKDDSDTFRLKCRVEKNLYLDFEAYKDYTCANCYNYIPGIMFNHKLLYRKDRPGRLFDRASGRVLAPQPEHGPIRQTFKSEIIYDKWAECCKQALECCKQNRKYLPSAMLTDELGAPQDDMTETKAIITLRDKQDVCPATWDGLVCWPDSKRGEIARHECPYYVYYLDYEPVCRGQVTKQCFENGSWYVRNDHEWSDFKTCQVESIYATRLLIGSVWHLISALIIGPSLIILNRMPNRGNSKRVKITSNLLFWLLVNCLLAAVQKAGIVAKTFEADTNPDEIPPPPALNSSLSIANTIQQTLGIVTTSSTQPPPFAAPLFLSTLSPGDLGPTGAYDFSPTTNQQPKRNRRHQQQQHSLGKRQTVIDGPSAMFVAGFRSLVAESDSRVAEQVHHNHNNNNRLVSRQDKAHYNNDKLNYSRTSTSPSSSSLSSPSSLPQSLTSAGKFNSKLNIANTDNLGRLSGQADDAMIVTVQRKEASSSSSTSSSSSKFAYANSNLDAQSDPESNSNSRYSGSGGPSPRLPGNQWPQREQAHYFGDNELVVSTQQQQQQKSNMGQTSKSESEFDSTAKSHLDLNDNSNNDYHITDQSSTNSAGFFSNLWSKFVTVTSCPPAKGTTTVNTRVKRNATETSGSGSAAGPGNGPTKKRPIVVIICWLISVGIRISRQLGYVWMCAGAIYLCSVLHWAPAEPPAYLVKTVIFSANTLPVAIILTYVLVRTYYDPSPLNLLQLPYHYYMGNQKYIDYLWNTQCHCWLQSSKNTSIEDIADFPNMVLITLNGGLFFVTLMIMCQMTRPGSTRPEMSLWDYFRAAGTLVFLFGAHYAMSSYRPEYDDCITSQIFYYSFLILDGLQGISVAYVFCYRTQEGRDVAKKWWYSKMGCGYFYRSIFNPGNHDFGNDRLYSNNRCNHSTRSNNSACNGNDLATELVDVNENFAPTRC